MKNIPLEILDGYAKRITNEQANMLYEAKNNKPYKKELYEKKENRSIYLNEYTLLEKAHKGCADFTYMLNEKYSDIMNAIYYKINEDSLTMRTDDNELYEKLVTILKENGIREDVYKN